MVDVAFRHSCEVARDLMSERLAQGKTACMSVWGTSMLPTLKADWRLQVKAVAPASLRVGDIAVFTCKDRLMAHRLVWRYRDDGEEYFVFKGDNQALKQTVTARDIAGKVVAIEKPAKSDGGKNKVYQLKPDLAARYHWLAYQVYQGIRSLKRALWGARKSRFTSQVERAMLATISVGEGLVLGRRDARGSSTREDEEYA